MSLQSKQPVSIRIAERYLLSHAFVAACVVALWMSTRLFLGHPLEVEPEMIVLFFASTCYYDLHVLSYSSQSITLRQLFFNYWPGLLLSGIAILISLPGCSGWFVALSAAGSAIAISYSVPLFTIKGKRYRLREWPVLKVLSVGIAYGLITVLVPCLDTSRPVSNASVCYLFLQRTIFIMCLCIPFEVRDQAKESSRGVTSILEYGNKTVRLFALLLLLLSVMSGYILLNAEVIPPPMFRADATVSLAVAMWILLARPGWPPWVFTYAVDGTMLLPPFLITLFCQWP